ncbi:hypothetical protein CEXT_291541 [Caerostris extrusa]|uniref:G-protein coupled receptors family 2 profile 2 domain-containing protein n=1 Tax=Caerostris extrusa TaxID=172846 RepID=A0AAV4ND48_CAEEX|nr:hypothetical protein CEXT_291541 [Caerostris extrusa]
MFYFIGWVFPVFPVTTFSILRWYFADEECWAIPVNPYEWVTNSPNLLSLILNFAFLCNIIRVLVTKLRATHTNEPSQFREDLRKLKEFVNVKRGDPLHSNQEVRNSSFSIIVLHLFYTREKPVYAENSKNSGPSCPSE